MTDLGTDEYDPQKLIFCQLKKKKKNMFFVKNIFCNFCTYEFSYSYDYERTYRFGKVPVGVDVVEVEGGGGVVLDHPGEHRVLGQVVQRS